MRVRTEGLSHLDNAFAQRERACMRSSVLQLNRSMESIERMIEKTRRLISRSKEPLGVREKVMINKGGSDGREDIGVFECSVRRVVCEGGKEKGSHQGKLRNSPQRDMKAESRHMKLSWEKMLDEHKFRGKDYKQNGKISSHTKQPSRKHQSIRKQPPSPALSSSFLFSQPKSNQKAVKNPQMPSSSTVSHPSKVKKPVKKQIFLNTSAMLIQDEQGLIKKQHSNHHYRYKTQQLPSEEPNSTFRVPQGMPPKQKITLKTAHPFKKSQITSHRSNRSTLQCVKMTARQELVEQLARLQTHSSCEAQRRQKFMLKIKKYGFVERYLTAGQIWKIYDNLVARGVPELEWPIAIVEEVYSRMGRPS